MIEERSYRLTFTTPLLGFVPKDKKTFEQFVAAKGHELDDPSPELQAELAAVPDEEGLKGVTGFFADENGIYLRDYQVKGFLKEAANTLKDLVAPGQGKKTGVKALRSKVEKYLFVEPVWIRLKQEPDAMLERPLRAQTMQGPRTCIAVSEMVREGLPIEVKLTLFQSEITWPIVEQLLDYGRFIGIGQFRGGSYGRFSWERV